MEDIRVLALGTDIIGALKRFAPKVKVVSNFSAGGDVTNFELNHELRSIVNTCMKALILDYAGIDIS